MVTIGNIPKKLQGFFNPLKNHFTDRAWSHFWGLVIAITVIDIQLLIANHDPVRPIEFDIPADATQDGELTLTWYSEPGRGAAGRLVHKIGAVVRHNCRCYA